MRPENQRCTGCGMVTEPYLIPAILDLPPRWVPPAERCEECVEKADQAEKQNQRQQNLQEAFQASRISPRFRDRTFENFSLTAENRVAYEASVGFQVGPEGMGLLFHGPCGIGKTHLAAAIANRLMGKMELLYISCPDLLLELREAFQGKRVENKLNIAKSIPLLFLDDIGAEKPSEWVQETLFVLLNYRYEHQLPTILTTNFSLKELSIRLGDRIVSRISQMCRCIKFEGIDWRVQRKEKAA